MKNFFIIICFICAPFFVFAGGKVAPEKDAAQKIAAQVVVYGLRGPSGIGMLGLLDGGFAFQGYDVRFEMLASADLMVGRLLSGEAKIGILPPNTAAKLYASGLPLQVAAVTGTGMLSLLSAAPDIERIEDLRGRRVAVAGQGAVPEFVFRKILEHHNTSPSLVAMDFSLAYPEIAASLIAGSVETALLPEPFATQARAGNPRLHDVADVQKEWAAAGGSAEYPMTVLVVNADFARENYGFVNALLENYRASINFVVQNPDAAGRLAEKHDIGLRAAVVSASIPKSNFVFLASNEARPAIEALFGAFLDYAPASIGGAMPGENFYF